MKKSLLFSLAASLFLATACSSDDKEVILQVGEIAVTAPDDLEEFDLNYTNQQKKLRFEWDAPTEGVAFSLLFSLSEEMENALVLSVGNHLSKELTHFQLDSILGKLGVGEYKRGELYWTIEGKNTVSTSQAEVRSMELFRFYKPFIDPRDNEEYRVCKVIDPLTGDYAVWLADNLRSTTYSDGTAVTGVKFYIPKEGEDASWTKKFGGYYTWTATVNGTKGAEEGEKIQGVAPTGWHIPTKVEWDFLINACDQGNGPGTELKDKSLWDPTSTNKGTNSIGFNMAGTGYIWSMDDEVIENFANTYFWASTAPKDGDVYPWNPNPADFPNQGVTYGFTKDDFGAALYPYDRTRGFSVRCVLD